MQSSEIRQKFLDFFEKRGHKHKIVPSSSLIPDDPSVLLTTAGMQQFKKYYTKELDAMRDFGSLNTVSIQKSFRTSDIDEVGDESHLTFFEMLGNFSFGGYFKREAIQYAYDFIVKEMGLTIDYVTVFDPNQVPKGDWRKSGVPYDEVSYKIWRNLGLSENQIKKEGIDVFWGPTGNEGPCGPTTEIYVKNAAGQSIEIWNIVFNEFFCNVNKKLIPLKNPGIDTGMGLERLAMVSQNVSNIFETDLFAPIFEEINKNAPVENLRLKRILADHIRAAVFMIADGIVPSAKERGSILRKLIRRTTHPDESQIPVARAVMENYQNYYQELKNKEDFILSEIKKEEDIFKETLHAGLKQFKKRVDPFILHTTYGFPFELTRDLLKNAGEDADEKDFQKKFKKHQEISRAGIEKKFGGHGLILDTGELKAGNDEELKKATRLHTATHLLQQALRDVLGDLVHQMGSDVTSERTRFDFSFSRKMTSEEIKKVEDIINEKIKKDLVMQYKELPKEEALKTGALHFFKEKYPEKVKVYYLGREGGEINDAYSKEFCGGPHVNRTSEIGEVKILKEEAVSAGVRRIRATID